MIATLMTGPVTTGPVTEGLVTAGLVTAGLGDEGAVAPGSLMLVEELVDEVVATTGAEALATDGGRGEVPGVADTRVVVSLPKESANTIARMTTTAAADAAINFPRLSNRPLGGATGGGGVEGGG